MLLTPPNTQNSILMASNLSPFILLLMTLFTSLTPLSQGSMGVCNGRVGSNLPSEQDTVELFKSNGIKRMRIYDPNPATLTALHGSDIELMIGVPNSDLESLQSDAMDWVQTNLRTHFSTTKIRYINVGNEVDPNNPDTSRFVPLVLPALQSVHRALTALGLQDQIKVSHATYSAVLEDSYPPSRARFRDPNFMGPIIQFLVQTRAPLLANIYPYIAYIGDPQHIPLSFALFTQRENDGNGYNNLFDALLDSMYYATEKAGGTSVEIVVSESGWPSDGGFGATMDNAATYYRNLMDHVANGTPKKPGATIETYLFAMFDENNKNGAESEKHFGLFYPSKEMKYQLTFTT